MNSQIIAIAAQMQNGKSTVIDHLSAAINWKKVAFARKVKTIYCDAFGVDLNFIEKWKTINECPPGFDLPVRKGLQIIGDGFRQIMGNVWIMNCFKENFPPMCIEDGRYINELIKVSKEGGYNILIWRPGYENDDPNGSEAQIRPLVDWFSKLKDNGKQFEGSTLAIEDWEGCPYGSQNINYFLINDGNIQDLHNKIDKSIIADLQGGGWL